MADYSTVDCAEIAGSWKEDVTDEETMAVVSLQCAYDDRWDLVADIVGNRKAWPKAPGSAAVTPRASKAAIQGMGERADTSGQECTYDEAIVTVTYTTRQLAPDEEENLFAEELVPSVEMLTLPYTMFRWTSGTGEPLQENEAPAYPLWSLTLNRTVYKVASVPAGVLTFVGRTNLANYTSSVLGLTFNAETLLYQGGSINRTISTDFNLAFDVQLSFGYKPETWNKFFRAKTGAYDEIFVSGGGSAYKNFAPLDMSDILF